LPCGASSDNHPHVSRHLQTASPAQQKKWIAARQGSTPPTSQSVHASIAQSNLGYIPGKVNRVRARLRPAPRRCGGHVAVHGRDKYLNLLACGGVALGSQRRPMPPRIADGNTPCVSMRPAVLSIGVSGALLTPTLRFGWRIGTSRLCNMPCSVHGCGKRAVSSPADAGSIIRAHKSCNRFRSFADNFGTRTPLCRFKPPQPPQPVAT
jgi:hypothetical protein